MSCFGNLATECNSMGTYNNPIILFSLENSGISQIISLDFSEFRRIISLENFLFVPLLPKIKRFK